MSKVFTLKTWLTIDEAIKHLSQVFNEKITKKDIYIFVIEHNLTLSFLCMGEVKAKAALVYSEPIEFELPNGMKARRGNFVKENFYLVPDWSGEYFYTPIGGIVDLIPTSCGISVIEEFLVSQDKNIFLEQVYIKTAKDKYYWLVDSIEVPPEPITQGPLKGTITRRIHVPIGELPRNVQLGVKTTELNLLINKLLAQNSPSIESDNQQIIANDSPSPYLLIAALLEQLKKHSPKLTQSKITAEIEETYKHIKGLSQSNTTKLIAEANRKIKDLKNKR